MATIMVRTSNGAAAITTTPASWLATRFGIKKVFVIPAAGFTLASMFCGIAQSISEIVLYRLLQGMFGAGLTSRDAHRLPPSIERVRSPDD
jgi:MFS family permease